MSSKFSLLASAMPTFTKKDTVEAKVDALADYQVQLLDYLRYTLGNLDADNFNPTGLKEILEPVVAEIKDTDGNILDLWMTAEELAAKIEDADGNYTSLKTTVEGLETEIAGVDGKYTSISATVNGIQSTVNSHTTTINNHTNKLNSQGASITSLQSQITQTANEIAAVVSAVDDSNGKVTAASIVAAINNAGSSVQISADHVNISGFVTFSDLSTEGQTTINAGNIVTGEIRAVKYVAAGNLYSGNIDDCIVVEDGANNQIGYIGYSWDGSTDRLWIATDSYKIGSRWYYPSLKLEAAGNISIEAYDELIYLSAPVYVSMVAGEFVFISDGISEWEFRNGNLYKNGIKVL